MILKPFYYWPARHIYNLVNNKEYLRWCFLSTKLGVVPRHKECTVRVHNWKLVLPDKKSFLSAYEEIFVNKSYFFEPDSDSPNILDLGANVGIGVLYFKLHFPRAKIVAYEADPYIFSYLKKNIYGNGYQDVELINKAVWDENTLIAFRSDGADGGQIAKADNGKTVEIEAVDVRSILRSRKFDFLKIDIEGAERTVLPAAKEYLEGIKYIFLEYHSVAGDKQKLDGIISILSEEGFRLNIYSLNSLTDKPKPFQQKYKKNEFDLQLNIFAYRI